MATRASPRQGTAFVFWGDEVQAGKRGQRLAAARDAQSTPFLISIINKVSSFRFGFWTGFFSTVQVLHEISQVATRFQRNFGLASGERAMG